MNSLFSQHQYDAEDLKEDIQRLLRATSDIADEAVIDARRRLKTSYGKAGEAWEHGARCAMKFVKGHVGETAAVSVLAGIAVGLLLSRRSE